jgi:hypothetical protein
VWTLMFNFNTLTLSSLSCSCQLSVWRKHQRQMAIKRTNCIYAARSE